MEKMKRMKHSLMALAILAALCFAACGGGEEPDNKPSGPTYTLTIREGSGSTAPTLTAATIAQYKTLAISRELKASDNSSTAGITFAYTCTTHTNCGVSVNNAGTLISVAPTTAAGAHAFAVTAVKANQTVATANFTVTVTLAPYDVSFNPNNFAVPHGASYTLNPAWTAPNGAVSGLTLDFACTSHPNCGLSFGMTSGTTPYPQINPVENTVPVGDHSITATLLNNGTAVTPAVTAILTARVRVKYTLNIINTTQDQFTVSRGDTFNLGSNYTLTASDGSTPNVGTVDANGDVPEGTIKVGVSCKSDYTNCDLFANPNRQWADLNFGISSSAGIKSHTMLLEAFDDAGNGDRLDEKQFTVTVTPAP